VGICVVICVPVWGFRRPFVPIWHRYQIVRGPRNADFVGISYMHRHPPILRNGYAPRAWRSPKSLSRRLGSFISNRVARPTLRRRAGIWSYRLRPTGLQAIY
jgi:hypothetical protein